MAHKGKVHKFGNDVNTDEIIPARYLNTIDKAELARHCMEDADASFAKKVKHGDVIVAGKNFGCGSSREHAPLAIKGLGIAAVVAPSFAGIFFRNSINIGLPFLELEDTSKIDEGDIVEIDLESGTIKNDTKGQIYKTQAFPEFLQELVASGGLMNWIKSKNKER